MKRIRTLTLTTLIAALVAAPAAMAFGPGGQRGPRGERLIEALDLTPDQQEAVEALRQQMRKEAEPLRKEMDAAREEMKQLWRVPELDRAAIQAKAAEIHAIHSQLRSLRLDHRLDVFEVLDAEQRGKFLEMQERRHDRKTRRGKRGKRGRRGGGPGGPNCPMGR
ncbi:MAG: Spy/CpxP family protein refolding chaperone [Myxococcota bacterium]